MEPFAKTTTWWKIKETMLGTVVVGIGTAGRVRIRDLLSPLSSSASEKMTVKGFVSRRSLGEEQGVKQISLEEALNREDIEVAIVSTENTTHEDQIRFARSPDKVASQIAELWPDFGLRFAPRVRLFPCDTFGHQRFLEAGKHVCVEYPMALSYTVAVELWDLAQQKGKVLHEEHIELLTADFKQLKKDVAGKNIQEGTLHFTGGPLQGGFGFPSFSGIARLTWLVELFGELTVKTASLVEEKENRYMKLTAQLLTQDQRPLTWIEERGPGLSRAKNINFRFDMCTMEQLPIVPREPVGLFMQDLNLFAQKLLGQVPPTQLQAERRRILHCLELADRIQQLSQESA